MTPESPVACPTVDECMFMDGLSRDGSLGLCNLSRDGSLGLCGLTRDGSFGWPPQDAELDHDPFSLPGHNLDFVFDTPALEGRESSWPIKQEIAKVDPESAWRQLATKLRSPIQKSISTVNACHIPATAPEPESRLELPAPVVCDRRIQSIDVPQALQPCDSNTYLGAFVGLCQKYQHESQKQLGAPAGDIVTIGIYSQKERAVKLLRYREKRQRRNFTKRVLYGCRKEFADSRPRVGGRFVIDQNRVVKPKTFLKRGRPRKTALPLISYLVGASVLS